MSLFLILLKRKLNSLNNKRFYRDFKLYLTILNITYQNINYFKFIS
jgi:hypothetical protein